MWDESHVGWNYLSILKRQRLHRWGLLMDNSFHLTLYNECNYLFMRGLKLMHFNEMGPTTAKTFLAMSCCITYTLYTSKCFCISGKKGYLLTTYNFVKHVPYLFNWNLCTWWHQDNTRTNVSIPGISFRGDHIMAESQEGLMIPIPETNLKSTFLNNISQRSMG